MDESHIGNWERLSAQAGISREKQGIWPRADPPAGSSIEWRNWLANNTNMLVEAAGRGMGGQGSGGRGKSGQGRSGRKTIVSYPLGLDVGVGWWTCLGRQQNDGGQLTPGGQRWNG